MEDAEFAADLVREAGRLAASMLADGLTARGKSELTDIVTAADHAAEAYVVARLRETCPDDAIVGEEGTDQPGTSGRTWVIDPVDGTWNFFHGLDWWCSALALTEGPDLVLGAIHHASTDRTWVGGPRHPGTVNGTALPPLVGAPLGQTAAATYLHPPYAGGPVAAAHQAVVARLATQRILGSASMDATAVASGTLGLSFQHSWPDWDFLPGAALVRSVGGAATQLDAAGVTWSLLGTPEAVETAADVLREHR
jgi:fructose-1,6-bisphosphatase/inositol monophosphatase family enzyme